MNTYKRHRFPPDIISHAVWLYYRFNLSHRDIEDLLAERWIDRTPVIRGMPDVGLATLPRQLAPTHAIEKTSRPLSRRVAPHDPCHRRSASAPPAATPEPLAASLPPGVTVAGPTLARRSRRADGNPYLRSLQTH